MEIVLRVHIVVRRILSPYESTLGADEGSVPYFLIWQGSVAMATK